MYSNKSPKIVQNEQQTCTKPKYITPYKYNFIIPSPEVTTTGHDKVVGHEKREIIKAICGFKMYTGRDEASRICWVRQ